MSIFVQRARRQRKTVLIAAFALTPPFISRHQSVVVYGAGRNVFL
nr:MAG TPA: hypothetical protein [Caudoviricetes sp.]DAM38565.1 MAG TPA: hypothetical protein [Caudoviricetes sp.]